MSFTRSTKGITSQGTETLNGEQGQESMWDSKFLCSEYDTRNELATNDTDSWEMDHSYETGKITIMGNTWGSNWTSGIHGIQGRLIIEYSE